MKVLAGLSQKDPNDKLPLGLAEQSIPREDGSSIRRQDYEDRIEKRILAALSVIVAICLVGTLVSVGGFIFLRYRARSLSPITPGQHRQVLMASLRVPITSPLKAEVTPSPNEPPVTVTTTKSPQVKENSTEPPSATSWFDDLLTSSSVSRHDKDTQESAFTAMKKKFLTPSFVGVRNQWSLEEPPSTKQLFGYVKQAFHYIRNNRYFNPEYSSPLLANLTWK